MPRWPGLVPTLLLPCYVLSRTPPQAGISPAPRMPMGPHCCVKPCFSLGPKKTLIISATGVGAGVTHPPAPAPHPSET